MGDVHTFLPKLTLNELLVRDLMAANSPCFALGYVEERGEISGCMALRPDEPIPLSSTQKGFRFGHSVLGFEGNPVLQFVFEFYGHATYHGLVSPGNPIVQSVLSTMIETEDYFLFPIKNVHVGLASKIMLFTTYDYPMAIFGIKVLGYFIAAYLNYWVAKPGK
jgi:hypothetical protein